MIFFFNFSAEQKERITIPVFFSREATLELALLVSSFIHNANSKHHQAS